MSWTRALHCPRWLGLLCLTALACPAAAKPPATVDFARDIRPILNKNCVSCHGGVKAARKISFIYRDSVVAENPDDEKPIHPGDPGNSELIHRITTDNEDDRMPPADHAGPLSEHDIRLLREWIRQGAPWKEHWAWTKPVAPVAPKVSNPKWIRQPLDAFVLAKLDAEKLKPAPAADRAQWLRRVSFDLTGLPPTESELAAFLSDKSPDAFEKVVNRLLAAPQFGERWASPWLDAARHADSMGYEKDALRTVWPYRDWVIRALNNDLPFDQFTLKQLAGDFLPDAKLEDQIATSFHRETPVNSEGGTDDEEYRIAAVIDRVNTTWEVWQGTTMRCAQCHSHPYEPIRHEEFYRSFALFNTTRDWDLGDDLPVLRVPKDAAQFTRADELNRAISANRRAEFERTRPLAARDLSWQPLTPGEVKSTKGTQLALTNTVEIHTVGTVAQRSQFTVDAPLPTDVTRVGALRIDVLPNNPAVARLTPETGFVITRFSLSVVTNQAATNGAYEIKLAHCFGDEAEPLTDDDAAVRGDKFGWGANPKLTQSRRAVFVPEQVVTVPEGATLRIVMEHGLGTDGAGALVTRRFRLAVTRDEDWIRFKDAADFKAGREELARLRKECDTIPDVTLPVMREQADAFRRATATFVRGNWLSKGDMVEPGVPAVFKAAQEADPTNRLALARWLVSPENPLTARVTANRIWAELFGVGIVETVEDFGSSGEPPFNPALLDHLAVRFQFDLGWSLKKLLREIVLSATYRQDARTTPKLAARDPRNRLLARGPRSRLSAEMVRDQALAASGLLSEKMFGPPVMPPQPEGIWNSPYNSAKWETATGEDRHRRALYTFMRRTAGYPSALVFDSPSREVCTTRRIRTNTPLQALVTLNDPVYVECAVALAARMRREAGENLRSQIAHGFTLATSRAPSKDEITPLESLHRAALARYTADPELASKLAPTPNDAALALVANALLNLDASLTK